MHDLEWKNDLTQNESQSEIKCEFEFSCIVSKAELIIYLVYRIHGFAGVGGRGIKNKNK